ncbi:HAMP domain-containing histidine kinase [Candidatus Fermentibacteria bacterium]|nr:HAMP domain-containing histidine kinase [Candidatus Fermentibacteria bacterium]
MGAELPRHEPSWLWPSGLLRGYLVGGSLLLAFAFLVYTQSVVNRMERQSLAFIRMFRTVLETEASDTSGAATTHLVPLFDEIRGVLHTSMPVVVTDPEDTVLFGAGIPVLLGRPLVEQPEPVRRSIRRMDTSRHRLPLHAEPGGDLVGYLIWGEHRVIRELRWMPPLEILTVGVFVLLGLLGLRRLKAAEQRSLWFGMAREAAHQLGTPISSLMGWAELLKAEGGGDSVPAAQVAAEMSRDIDRLSKVARRFERIGHPPHVETMDVRPIIEETANYFRARVPHQERGVRILEDYGRILPVKANRELLTWVLENLVRNSIEALGDGGEVVLRTGLEPRTNEVRIQVEDSGRGMTGRVRSRAFKPGFSTKARGWGLGLAMARRIVEEYHGGRLRIVRSQPGRGTLMEITLPGHDRGQSQ